MKQQLPTQQVGRSYPGAAGYSKDYPKRYHVRGLVTVLTVAFVGFFVLATCAIGFSFGFPGADPVTLLLFFGVVLLMVVPLFTVFALAGVFIYRYVKAGKTRANALDQHGVVTQGEVIDLWSMQSFDKEGHKVTAYFVAYRYGGCAVQQAISYSQYQTYVIGVPVRVRYLPNSPLVARLEDYP